MTTRRSHRLLRGVVVAVLTAALFLHACGDQSTSPDDLASKTGASARGSGAKRTLTINGTGSTASGTLVSDRGGLSCSVTYASGRVSTSGKCSKQFNDGWVLDITATPPVGGTVTWTGCDAPVTDSPLSCQVTMTANKVVTAAFAPPANSFALTVLGGSNGTGTVQSSPSGIACTITAGTTGANCSGTFPNGSSVTLSASAAAGSYIKAWSGGGCETNGTGVGGASGSCAVAMSQAQSVVISFETGSDLAKVGKWDIPISWPNVAIHASVLPDGRVLTYGRPNAPPAVWDPTTGAFITTAEPADFFCSGSALLPDGRLLVAGGHSGRDNFGIRATYLFDASTNSWTRSQDMANGRWYPTNTTLSTGEMLTISGGDTAGVRNLIPEVWSGGSWRSLTSASRYVNYYPMMFVAPDGTVYMAGSGRGTAFLNTAGTGSWTQGLYSNFGERDYGSAVMYDAGKILLVGGGAPTATAEVIDLNDGSPWRYVGSMRVPRRQLNATLLADGTVLVTGGSNASGFNTAPTDSRVLSAERWDPATEQFTTLAAMSHNRLYHSTAMLLPDGRLLSVGSGQPAAVGLTDDYTAEIFTPPYLYRLDGTLAPRPQITSAPTSVAYGAAFQVQTPQASTIVRATWIRLSSVTHAFNQNQRMNRLTVTPNGSGSVLITAPSGPTMAPPGHYMLFLIDANGVPSVAKIVRIG
ncbi:MAG TPA: galactose oxidase-like domain-containing protein [Gemmatimonadales bacterium]|nr:galactose oxidase-like domain-containing protein [Gemmatimonadales bacterium]